VLRKKCDICQDKKLSKDPAQVYIDTHYFLVCDECEMLLSIITEKVNEHEKLIGDIDEQPI